MTRYNKGLTTILNTNDRKVKTIHIKLLLEPFEESSSKVSSSKSDSQNRIKLVVLCICTEFNGVFYLPNELH